MQISLSTDEVQEWVWLEIVMVVLVKACLVIIQRQSMSSWIKYQWLYRYRKWMNGYQWGDRRVKGNTGVGQKKHKGLLWNYMKSCVWNFWKLLSTLEFNLSFNKINHIILQLKRMPLFRFRKCLVNLPLFHCNSIHSCHDPTCLRLCLVRMDRRWGH